MVFWDLVMRLLLILKGWCKHWTPSWSLLHCNRKHSPSKSTNVSTHPPPKQVTKLQNSRSTNFGLRIEMTLVPNKLCKYMSIHTTNEIRRTSCARPNIFTRPNKPHSICAHKAAWRYWQIQVYVNNKLGKASIFSECHRQLWRILSFCDYPQYAGSLTVEAICSLHESKPLNLAWNSCESSWRILN